MFFLCSEYVFSQGGADCSSSINILSGVNTSLGGSTQYFKYKALQNGVATVSACDATINYSIVINQNCTGIVDTFKSICSSGKNETSFLVKGGMTYNIALTANGDKTTTYQFTLAIRNSIPGETCDDAIVPKIGDNNYNNNGSLPVWYVYHATKDTRVNINTCGFNYPLFIKGFAGCNPNDSIQIFHNSCSSSQVDRDNAFFYAKKDQNYYLQWRNPVPGRVKAFTFSLTELLLKVGETCDDPKLLTLGIDSTGHDFVKWYTYVNNTLNPQKILISSCGNNAFYAQVRISCGENDFERSVKHEMCGKSTTTFFQALPGTIYYVKVYPSINDTFSVKASVPLKGETCANPYNAVAGTNHADHTNNTDQWYVYTSTVAGTFSLKNHNWTDTEIRFFRSCGDKFYSIGETSHEIGAHETVYILLRNEYVGAYDWSFTFEPSTPGSDRISAIEAKYGNNLLSAPSKNIWYKYTPAVSSNLHMSTCLTTTVSSYLMLQDKYGRYLGASSGLCNGRSDITIKVEGGETVFMNWTSTDNIISFDLDTTKISGGILPPGSVCSNPLTAIAGVNTSPYAINQLWQWFTYTASADGTLEVDNCSNNGPSKFTQVYIQSDCGEFDRNTIALGKICGTFGSGTSVKLTAGQKVFIAWFHIDLTAGSIVWNLNFKTDAQLAKGYTCSNPIIAGVTNIGNTSSGDEFFIYNPPANGKFNIHTDNTIPLYAGIYLSCDYYDPSQSIIDNPIVKGNVGVVDIPLLSVDCSVGNSYLIVWKKGYSFNNFNWSIEFTENSKISDITAFSIPDQLSGNIDAANKMITVKIPANINITMLKPAFTISPGATAKIGDVMQFSGVTVNNFTVPKTYKIIAEDGISSSDWMISVSTNVSVKNKFDNADIKVYPVPSNGIVNIDFLEDITGSWNVQLINEAGQIALTSFISGQKSYKLDISKLPFGIYNLMLVKGDVKLLYRILVK